MLQLTAGDDIVLVDPLAVDVGPLRRLLDSDAECIMHAASQDLEILERACGVVPRRLVDTQIAAGFVGLGSPGLGVIPSKFLHNTNLNLTHSFSIAQMSLNFVQQDFAFAQ